MSESRVDEIPWGTASAPHNSAGSILRQARLEAGVHVESIAFALKVPVEKIEALELDNLSVFPDIVFMRALASSVCRGLRIDAAPVLALMPQGTPRQLTPPAASINARFRDSGPVSRTHLSFGRHSRWLVFTVVMLFISAALVAWMPESWTFSFRSPSRTMTVHPEVVAEEGLAKLATEGALKEDREMPSAVPNSFLGSSSTTSKESLVAQATQSTAITSPLAPLLSAESPGSGPPQAQAQALEHSSPKTSQVSRLSFRARAETWVQVTDEKKKVVLERTLKSGETVSVDHMGLLSVVVGRADQTDVTVLGLPRDITKSARDNVARFEVGG